jgi:hypothetical protein
LFEFYNGRFISAEGSKLKSISTSTNRLLIFFNAYPSIIFFYIKCLIDILELTLKCGIQPTLVLTMVWSVVLGHPRLVRPGRQ